MLEGEAKEEKFKPLLRRAVLLPIVLLLGTAAVFTWAATRVLADGKLVTLSDEIIEHATRPLRLAVDMETGVCGYQVTGSKEFLQPSEAALPGERARAFAAGSVGDMGKPIQALNFVAQVRSFLRSAEEKKP